jgi:UrcA family protein
MSTSTTTRAAGSRFKFALLVVASGLGCAMGAGTATAATADNDVPSLVIHYSSQSLATDDGVQHLYGRIVRAAREVCPDPSVRDLGTRERIQECRAQALAHAIQQIHNSRLAALYAASAKRG